jgi:hypothetical protein
MWSDGQPEVTLTPQPYGLGGARVRFDCGECGHTEVFHSLPFADRAHVMAGDHYRGECSQYRYAPGAFDDHRTIVAQRERWARDHRTEDARLGVLAVELRRTQRHS